MSLLRTRSYSIYGQYAISLFIIAGTSILCFLFTDLIGYRAVALILLMAVSLNAILFDILPVILSALLSALIWNFFFIPPILTFHIGTPEDALMFLMYFVIASISAVLTHKIREVEHKERAEEQQAKAIRLYGTLLNSLSHELRTPISAIIGAIDTIHENRERLSDTDRDDLHTEIGTAAIRLNRQVENLLNMSRLEAGFVRPVWDWCDLNELVFSVIGQQRDETAKHTIAFTPDEALPLFRLDRGLMEQILHNVLHNALQHTPAHSTITMSADRTEKGFRVTVSDNGNGFPEDEIGHVFDKFYRLKRSATGGTGLGLSIVRGFVEAMEGTVSLRNLPEGGAAFTIDIPCATSDNHELTNEQGRDSDH